MVEKDGDRIYNDIKEKIKGLSEDTLDTIAVDIFEINSIEELES